MKITSIKQQVRRAAKYSVMVDGKYAFSLSETALLESKLVNGQNLSNQHLTALKALSTEDKIYNLALRYLALRPRSEWEIEYYLQRKTASPALINSILSKLRVLDLLNDEKFAKAYVNDRRLLRPTSRRKIIMELRKKHLADNIIQQAVGDEAEDDRTALRAIVERKRHQSRYHDDMKLMQYLARQGFSYGDIKSAMQDIISGV